MADARRWAGSDLAIGSGLIVLLIALFLPWFTETVQLRPGPTISAVGNGPRAHGYLWFVFALALVALVVLIARDAIDRIPGNLPSVEQILVGTIGLSLLLTLLGLALRPAGGYTGAGGTIPIQSMLGHMTVTVGWSYGGFIAVLAAAVAFVAAFGIAGPMHAATSTARARWHRPRTDS